MSAADIRSWGRDVRAFADDAPGDAITVVDGAIRARLHADTGDGAFSRGKNLGRATTQITTGVGEAGVSASGSRRVWAILENGTTAHEVRARGARGVLATPFGPRARVKVSGVAPRHTFTEGADRGLTDAAKRLESDWGRI